MSHAGGSSSTLRAHRACCSSIPSTQDPGQLHHRLPAVAVAGCRPHGRLAPSTFLADLPVPPAFARPAWRLLPQADKQFLVGMKQAQVAARLADDEAAGLVKEAARSRVENLLDSAVKCIKQRTRVRDYTGACLRGC